MKIKHKTFLLNTFTVIMIILSISVSISTYAKHQKEETIRFQKIEEKLADVNDLVLQDALDMVTFKNGENQMAIRNNFFYPAVKNNPEVKYAIKDFTYDKNSTTMKFVVIDEKNNTEVQYEWAFIPSEEKFKTKVVDIKNNNAKYEIVYRPEDIGLKRDHIFDFLDYDDDDKLDIKYFDKHMNENITSNDKSDKKKK